MITQHIPYPAIAVITLALALGGCNTQPKRQPPPPKPVASEPRQPPPPAQSSNQTEQQRDPAEAQSQAPPPATAQQNPPQNFSPPSADAAEVEIEEIHLDENGNPIKTETVRASAPAQSAAQQQQRGGGGGAPPPPRGARQSDDAGGGSGLIVLTPDGEEELPVGPNIQIGASTDDEDIAALDARLNRQLALFDERLRRAREAAEAERESQRGGGGGGAPSGAADGEGYLIEKPPEFAGAGGAAATGSGLGNTPDTSGTTESAPRKIAHYAQPADIPDGRDDDIVARQLREAAEQEKDPVLRDKLWEEYKRYKAGL